MTILSGVTLKSSDFEDNFSEIGHEEACSDSDNPTEQANTNPVAASGQIRVQYTGKHTRTQDG